MTIWALKKITDEMKKVITTISFTIEIPPKTKKNSMQILVNPKTKRPFIAQSSAYKAYRKAALTLIPKDVRVGIDYPVNIKYTFYTQTRRRVDALNLSAACDDILVDAGVITDDNRDIVAGHDGTRVYHDKDRPRVEVEITPMDNYEQWKSKE